MAKFVLSLSKKSRVLSIDPTKTNVEHEVLLRFYHNKIIDQRAKTNVFVQPDDWDSENRTIGIAHIETELEKCNAWRMMTPEREKQKSVLESKKAELTAKINRLNAIIDLVRSSYDSADKNNISDKWLKNLIEDFNSQSQQADEPQNQKSFFDWFESFMESKKYKGGSAKAMRVVERALGRYQGYMRAKRDKSFTLDINTITKDTIIDFFEYFQNEFQLAEQDPKLYKSLLKDNPTEITAKHKTAKIEERGYNHIVNTKKKLKCFFNWLNKEGYSNNHPFDGIEIGSGNYGDPIILSLDERNKIGDFDLSATPHLEHQRDIFVFQCLVGCRVGDLLKMTPDNVVADKDGLYIQYIPRKTKDKKPVTATVPLNERATALLAKYKNVDLSAYKSKNNRKPLLPFISAQKYNEAIKEIFKLCGINRMVMKLNPISGEEESKPLYEVASSHMARRCFVGNLYNKVADPNLIGSMSGHVENSKAFARYRKIEMENKKRAVDLIN